MQFDCSYLKGITVGDVWGRFAGCKYLGLHSEVIGRHTVSLGFFQASPINVKIKMSPLDLHPNSSTRLLKITFILGSKNVSGNIPTFIESEYPGTS